eukprot:1569860-Prorocentrum_lima.AAC.1
MLLSTRAYLLTQGTLGPSWLPRLPRLGYPDKCANFYMPWIQTAVSTSSLATLVLNTRGPEDGFPP